MIVVLIALTLFFILYLYIKYKNNKKYYAGKLLIGSTSNKGPFKLKSYSKLYI